ncbi:MAG: T9SS type A sorting domain-containing protein, partial [Bacteroidota bacterium]
YFNYEAPGCANPANEGNLDNQSLIGATLVATSEDGGGDTGSDFTLLTLNDPIPDTYAPYFAGWSRLDVASLGGASIHHPDGDIKKISTYTSPLTSTSFGGVTPNTHWSVTWVATANGHGVTEAGSSGSPLYNLSGQIVGTETGGSSFCTSPGDPDEYGKFSYHWESNGNGAANRLSNWLDPDNTGLNQLAGREGDCSITSVETVVVNGLQARLFPNPAQDQVVLEWAVNTPIQLTAYDALGSVVATAMAGTAQGGRIALATGDWPPGVYMLSASAGNLQWNGRLVVQP